MSHDLVICTLDRPAELGRCLASVAEQRIPPTRVVVVDASESLDSRQVVDSFDRAPLLGRFTYVRFERGLTRQRNAGLGVVSSDIVHFVDDDTVLEPRYLEAILETFAGDARGEILGVGGTITNFRRSRVTLAKRLFLLDGTAPGRVLPSGRNQPAIGLTRVTDVDWLSGCAMSFRRTALEGLSFDESFAGYGLGEDVELTYRLRQRGRLVVTPAARLEHLQSERNRLAQARYTHDEIVNRSRRVRARTGRMRMRWYWWSVAGQLGGLAGASMLRPSGPERDRLGSGIAAVREVVREGRAKRSGR